MTEPMKQCASHSGATEPLWGRLRSRTVQGIGFVVLSAATFLFAENTTAAEPSSIGTVYVHDGRPLRQLDLGKPENAVKVWDTLHAFTALQGIVNRETPRLYLDYCQEFGVDTDRFWLDWLQGEDGWLRGTQTLPLDSLQDAVARFREHIKGLVVYDPAVPATSCVASTAAGCEDLIPVRFSRDANSVYALLTGTLKLPVRLWLVNPDGTPKFTGRGMIPDLNETSTGSAKADAYRWAIRRYIESGRSDTRYAAFYIDAFWLTRPTNGSIDLHTLSNHDYFIARRAFFFDLSPWGDEQPVDDLRQTPGLDKQILMEVLKSLQAQSPQSIIKIGGFPPWPFKYTTHGGAGKHEGVPTEWEFTRIISQFNAYHEADAAGPGAMANASFFAHYPLAERYPQPNPKPGLEAFRKAGHVTHDGKVAPRLYVGHYVGDYDAPSWLYKAVPAFFNDPQRGSVPLGWAFDPNLADRAPQAMAYAYRHATTKDFFISGDSGAGYLNPRSLTVRPDSKLPSGLPLWTSHCLEYFRRWDMTITGFVLDGSGGRSTELEFEAYRAFSPDGCGTHYGWPAPPRLIAGIPTVPHWDLPQSAAEAAAFIARQAEKVRDTPRFLWARSILRPPSWYAEVSRILRDDHPNASIAVVDPYTFFGLAGIDAATRNKR